MPSGHDVRRNDQQENDRRNKHGHEVKELPDRPRENDRCAREGKRTNEVLRRSCIHDPTAGCQRGTKNAEEVEAYNQIGREVLDATARLQQHSKDKVVNHRVEEGAEDEPD